MGVKPQLVVDINPYEYTTWNIFYFDLTHEDLWCAWRNLKPPTKVYANLFTITVQPAYMKRFGAAKTVPYIQKSHIREVHLYIYLLGIIASET